MFKTVEIKIVQFNDDATILVDEISSKRKVIKQIDNFGLFSGLELNKDKCSLVNVNDYSIGESVDDISWTNSDVKILGVYFGKDKDKINDKNWSPKFNKIENCIRLWKTRNLTVFGKMTIIKSFLVSQIIFNAQMISIPNEVIKKINSLLYSFLWNGKKEKIKRKVLCMEYELGGLKMVDLDTLLRSFRLKWILVYFSSNDSKWGKKTVDGFFSKVGSFEFILNSNINKQDIKNYFKCVQIPPYYKEMVYYWIDLKQLIETDSKITPNCNVQNEDIWFHSNVKTYDGNVLFYKKWFNAGIRQIKDIEKLRIYVLD